MSARGRGVLHGRDLVAFHRRLQRADRVDLGDEHAAAGLPQRSGRALADVAEARNHGDLPGHHHVGAAANAVDQRLAAAIEIVELRLGHAVVDVDRRPEQRALLLHFVEPVHAGRGFLGHAADGLGILGVPAGLVLEPLLDRREQDFLFLVGRLADQGGFALLGALAEVDQERGIAAVVEDHVRRAAVTPLEDAMLIVPVVLERLALDGEHRRAAGGHGGGGVILSRIDVARSPAHVGAERLERVDQHRGLDGHVQRAADARPAERLLGPVFLARRHQSRHLGLGDGKFLAAPFGQADVLDHVVGIRGGGILARGSSSLGGVRCSVHDGP